MDNVKSVSLGYFHSAAITEDGILYTWGYNGYGQLGNGTTIDSSTPIKIMDIGQTTVETPIIDPNETETDEYIINEVRKYCTDTSEAATRLQQILTSNTTYNQKQIELLDYLSNYGIADVHEGLEFLSQANSYRHNYITLTTDEIYCASNYYQSMFLKQGILNVAGLVYNLEIFDYASPWNWAEGETPGIKKCKKVLQDFLEDQSSSCDALTYAQNGSKFLSNAVKLNNIATDYTMDSLMDDILSCTDQTRLTSLQSQYTDLLVKAVNANNTDQIYLSSDSISTALGYSGTVISFAGATADDIMTLLNLSNEIKIYQNYSEFLIIVANSKTISSDMRNAAKQMLDDINNGYYNTMMSMLHNCFTFAKDMDCLLLDVDVFKSVFGEVASDAVGTFKLAVLYIKLCNRHRCGTKRSMLHSRICRISAAV